MHLLQRVDAIERLALARETPVFGQLRVVTFAPLLYQPQYTRGQAPFDDFAGSYRDDSLEIAIPGMEVRWGVVVIWYMPMMIPKNRLISGKATLLLTLATPVLASREAGGSDGTVVPPRHGSRKRSSAAP